MLKQASLKSYLFSLVLITAIICGATCGYFMGSNALILKPIGDIFLNLLFTAVVPLVFFSVASAVANLGESERLVKLIISMFSSFIFTGIIAAAFMILVVTYFPPALGVSLKLSAQQPNAPIDIAAQLVNSVTVADFTQLFSHKNMLPLIFFSLLVGLAAGKTQKKMPIFVNFLQAGADVFMQIISMVMYFAPFGFFAFFAILVAELGPQFMQQYLRVTIIYYTAAIFYFLVFFTFYAYLAGGRHKIRQFWRNAFLPIMTSLATCSSAASIPVNLEATKNMGVPATIYETVIPVGAIMHKDGSVLGGIVKIAFLFGLYGMHFTGITVLLPALLVAILVGTVMGAIPSGGMLGEMVILSFYGFPPECLVVIAAISIITDPIATMLNVLGDCLCSMLVARFCWK